MPQLNGLMTKSEGIEMRKILIVPTQDRTEVNEIIEKLVLSL